MLVHRLRRWPNIKTPLVQCLVLAVVDCEWSRGRLLAMLQLVALSTQSTNVVLMLLHCLQRWPNIKAPLVQCLVIAYCWDWSPVIQREADYQLCYSCRLSVLSTQGYCLTWCNMLTPPGASSINHYHYFSTCHPSQYHMFDPMLDLCWADVVDGWVNASCLLEFKLPTRNIPTTTEKYWYVHPLLV